MKLTQAMILAGLLSLGTAVHAQDAARPAPIVSGGVVEFRTTLLGVDAKKRTIQVADDNGKPVTFVVGPEVQNFEQMRKGDKVVVAYERSVAISVAPGDGIRSRVLTEGADRAAPGQRPAADAARNLKVVATVQRIDRKSNVVTLRGPQRTVDVAVEDPKLLEGVKVGDAVTVNYTEALAVAVTQDPNAKRKWAPPVPAPAPKP
jgi:Cu/Ag efflux protein CusF